MRVMRAAKKVLTTLLWGALGVVTLIGILFFYFVYSPTPAIPHLSGVLAKQSINAGGLKRTYRT